MAADLYTLCFPPFPTVPDSPCELYWDDLSLEENEDKVSCAQEDPKRKRNQRIVLTEKKRRKTMRQLYSKLQSLLPFSIKINLKVAREYLIEETGKYINQLQNKVQRLQQKKSELLLDKKPNPALQLNRDAAINVDVDIYNNDEVIIRITASRMPCCLWRVYEEVEAHDLDIQSTDVYSGNPIVFLYFHAKLNCTVQSGLQRIQRKPALQASLQSIY